MKWQVCPAAHRALGSVLFDPGVDLLHRLDRRWHLNMRFDGMELVRAIFNGSVLQISRQIKSGRKRLQFLDAELCQLSDGELDRAVMSRDRLRELAAKDRIAFARNVGSTPFMRFNLHEIVGLHPLQLLSQIT